MLSYLHTIRLIPNTLQCSLKCVSDTAFPMGHLSYSCIALLLILRAGEGALISQCDLPHQLGQAASQELLLLWALPAFWIQNVFCNELYQRVPLNKADFSGKSLLSAERDRKGLIHVLISLKKSLISQLVIEKIVGEQYSNTHIRLSSHPLSPD